MQILGVLTWRICDGSTQRRDANDFITSLIFSDVIKLYIDNITYVFHLTGNKCISVNIVLMCNVVLDFVNILRLHFWPVDGGGHENQVRPEEFLHQRKRDGCSLINDQQFSLTQLHCVARVDVLLDTWPGQRLHTFSNGKWRRVVWSRLPE